MYADMKELEELEELEVLHIEVYGALLHSCWYNSVFNEFTMEGIIRSNLEFIIKFTESWEK